ncbi:DUF2283 domain-containing protein [Desulfosoma sp.]
MRVIYDSETDTRTVIFIDTPLVESDDDWLGVILDYDEAGNLVSLEVLDAWRRVGLPYRIECLVVPSGVSLEEGGGGYHLEHSTVRTIEDSRGEVK